MEDSEKREYVGEFCRKLLEGLREALPDSRDIIPTPEDGVVVYHDDGDCPRSWIMVQKVEVRIGGVFAWCSMLPLTHVDEQHRHVESRETRQEVLEKAREVLRDLLEKYPHVDCPVDAVCECDFWNGGFIHRDGTISTRRLSDDDREISGYAQIVFDPEDFGWKD